MSIFRIYLLYEMERILERERKMKRKAMFNNIMFFTVVIATLAIGIIMIVRGRKNR